MLYSRVVIDDRVNNISKFQACASFCTTIVVEYAQADRNTDKESAVAGDEKQNLVGSGFRPSTVPATTDEAR